MMKASGLRSSWWQVALLVLGGVIIASYVAHDYRRQELAAFENGVACEILDQPAEAIAFYQELLSKGDDLPFLADDFIARCYFLTGEDAQCQHFLDKVMAQLEKNSALRSLMPMELEDTPTSGSRQLARLDSMIALAGAPAFALQPNKLSPMGTHPDNLRFILSGLSAPWIAKYYQLLRLGEREQAQATRAEYLAAYRQACAAAARRRAH